MLTDANPYLLLAVNGFFTGMGVVTANWIYDRLIKDKLDSVHKRIKKVVRRRKK